MQIKFDVDILKFELLLLLFTKVNRLYKKRKGKIYIFEVQIAYYQQYF